MPDDSQNLQNVPKLDTPEQRIAFMKSVGVPEGFYIVSAKELFAIDQGTSKLHGQVRNWQVLSQAVFGVNSPEEALEVAKRQKIHRQGIMEDRMRFRNALAEILVRSRRMMANCDVAELGDLARDAINGKPKEGK